MVYLDQSQIGLISLKVLARDPQQGEVGFILAPVFQGKGFAKLALLALIHFSQALDFKSLTAWVTAGNLASEALLKRSGFRFERRLKNSLVINGTTYDVSGFKLELNN
ncbi:GNAT family N-acetyltransferase [Paraferrimonas sedimenticola]|uniref:N-acetyltransferase domain-containing protein n=1 Tax=Paraferrimonas sedimenticola TaxID=375674 RepID=A0AA37RSG9_9GAMM|nr:hypothetical protein GCM10007895_04360 [Paraferrimonas sedimenticola]